MNKISIIMPVHNGEKYLSNCIISLRNQTFNDFELICVINGSTDKSEEIIADFVKQDSRIKYIKYNKGNAGFARNEGKKIATGEYIIFLDCDDFFEKNFLNTLYKTALKSNADITMCDVFTFNDKTSENKRDNTYINKFLLKNYDSIVPQDWSTNICKLTSTVVWNRLYKVDFINRIGVSFQEIKSCNDMYFSVLTLLCANKIELIKQPLLHYRTNHNNSITKKYSQSYEDIIEVVKGIETYFSSHKELSIFRNSLLNLYVYHLVAHYVKINDSNARLRMRDLYKQLDLSDFSKIDCGKKSFDYIFNKDFINNKSNILSRLLCKSKYCRGLYNLI